MDCKQCCVLGRQTSLAILGAEELFTETPQIESENNNQEQKQGLLFDAINIRICSTEFSIEEHFVSI